MGLLRSIAAAFFRCAKRSSTCSEAAPEDPRHRLGREGERLASRYLRRCGYKVLYRNFRPAKGNGRRGSGEVDLVCRDGDTLVFVEVKTRRSEAYGTPAEAVTAPKQALIVRGALAWLRMLDNPDIHFRFDIVEVLFSDGKPACSVIRNAFTLPEAYRYQATADQA